MATHILSGHRFLALGLCAVLFAAWSPRAPGTAAAQDPQAGAFQSAGQSMTLMPDGRWLMVGGWRQDGSPKPTVLIDARGNITPLIASLSEPRVGHSATLLPDGSVLIIGGVGRNSAGASSLERFDPQTQQFLPVRGGAIQRAFHSTTLLSDGQVLVAGGTAEGGSTAVEILTLNPVAPDAPVVIGTLSGARNRHTARLLADGRVQLSGGVDGVGRAVSKTEVVDPLSGLVLTEPFVARLNDLFVIESSPLSGANNVARDVTIRLRFSLPAQVPSVSDQTVTLSDATGNPVPVRVVPAESGMLAFVSPLGALRPGESYTLTLDGARTTDGRVLARAIINFTTEGKTEAEVIDDEFWMPSGGARWTTNRSPSPWEQLPRLQAAPGVTAVSGQVLRLDGKPLSRVTLTVGRRMATTDTSGRFLVQDVPTGRQVLRIDGRTASSEGRVYGLFDVGVDILSGRTNDLPFTNWMPRLDTRHAITLPSPTVTETVLTTPYIPGLEVRLPAGTVIRDADHQIVRQVSITPIPVDRPPFPLPAGVSVPIYFTLQPGSAYLETTTGGWPSGARVIYPNYHQLKAKTIADFWQYEPEDKGWFVYGSGRVTADQKQIVPDPGVALYQFTGAMIGSPFFSPNEAQPPCEKCEDGDPVDLSTGLFVYRHTDLSVADALPLTLNRTYRSRDFRWRPFGIGASHDYESLLIGDASTFSYVDVVLGDGATIHYPRTNAGTDYQTAVFEHVETPTRFYKSQIRWNTARQGWDLKFADGTIFKFPNGAGATSPAFTALVGITDRFGNSITFTRDAATGDLKQITSSNGRWIKFTYDGNSRIIEAKDNIGRTVVYTYDATGRLWKVTDPELKVTEFTYDSAHRLIDIKDPRGNIFVTNEYDTNGRVIKQTAADGAQYQFVYTLSAGRVTQTDVTDPRGFVRRVTFDAKGYWLTDTRALGKTEQRTITLERDPISHRVTKKTDGLLRQTTYGYNAYGAVTSVTRLANTANPVSTTATYDPTFQQLASVTDPLTHSTTYDHDSRGALTSIVDHLNHAITITPNAAGQPEYMSDPSGTIRILYQGGVYAGYVDNAGNTTGVSSDGIGRVIAQTDALGNSRRFEYDKLNRVLRVYDARDALTATEYDGNGNLLAVTDARTNRTEFGYDVMDRVERRTDALTRVERFVYDLSGNLRQHLDRRGFTTTYQYDGLSRLSGITYADGSTTTYSYDAADRLRQIVDSLTGLTTLGYDDLDHLTSETIDRPGEPQRIVTYTYDNADRRRSMTVSGQTPINYEYDDANRLLSITQGTSVVSFTYDDANRRSSMTLPTGNSVFYEYDATSRLATLTYKYGTTVLGQLTYHYDAAGRRTQVSGSLSALSLPQAVSTTDYNAANQLMQWSSRTLTYDLAGNLISDGTGRQFSWDARSHLQSVSGNGGATYSYDAIGRRIQKVEGGTSTGYLYDGTDVVQEIVGGAPSANLVLGLGVDELLLRSDATGQHGVFSDALGSVIGLTDSTGAISTRYTYEPFGAVTVTGAATANATQFTGREADASGLYYYRARYYDPQLSRFTAEDPRLFLTGDANLYAYAGNMPTVAIDPTGEEFMICGRLPFMNSWGRLPGQIAESASTRPVRPSTPPLPRQSPIWPPEPIYRPTKDPVLEMLLELLSKLGGNPGVVMPQPGGKSGKAECRPGIQGCWV